MNITQQQADLLMRLVVALLTEDDTGETIAARYAASVEASLAPVGRRFVARDAYHRVIRDRLLGDGPLPAAYYNREQLELLLMHLVRGMDEENGLRPNGLGEGRLIEQLSGFLSATPYTLNRLNWNNLWSLRRALLVPEEFAQLDQVLDAETRCKKCGGALVPGEIMTFDTRAIGQRQGAGIMWCSRCSPVRRVKCTFEGCNEVKQLNAKEIAALQKFRCTQHTTTPHAGPAQDQRPEIRRPVARGGGIFANAMRERMDQVIRNLDADVLQDGAPNDGLQIEPPQVAQNWGIIELGALDPEDD